MVRESEVRDGELAVGPLVDRRLDDREDPGEERVEVFVRDVLDPVGRIEDRLRRSRTLGPVPAVEAVFVGLGESEDVESLAKAPGRVRTPGLGVEAAQELVAAHFRGELGTGGLGRSLGRSRLVGGLVGQGCIGIEHLAAVAAEPGPVTGKVIDALAVAAKDFHRGSRNLKIHEECFVLLNAQALAFISNTNFRRQVEGSFSQWLVAFQGRQGNFGVHE